MMISEVYEQEFRDFSYGFRPGRSAHQALSHPDEGTPQGGVISPLLANIYLHDVLDEWFVRDVKPALAGHAELFRFADDAVALFASKQDAERFLAVLPERFGKFGLTLHPDKTRMVPFRR